jgi:integrase
MKSELTKEGLLAPATVKHVLVLFRQIVNKAIAWGLYQGMNPVKGVKLPMLQNQRERFLSYEEADKLLSELKSVSSQVHDIVLISLHTGMRASEIFNLKGNDIDMQHSLISILEPKNNQSRKAYMTKTTEEVLSKYASTLPDEYIFRDSHGNRYKEIPKIYRIVANRLFNQGVKDSRQKVLFHSLRHSFGAWLALQGESLVTIRELLGHKSYTMTQRYAHLIPDEKKRATLALEKAFELKRNGASIKEGRA